MATPTYVSLATLTLTGNEKSIVFSSIPAGYRDLILVTNMKANATNDGSVLLNGSSSNFSWVRMIAGSFGIVSSTATTNTFTPHLDVTGHVMLQFMDYSATDKHKTILLRAAYAGIDRVDAYAVRWADTSAINSVRIDTNPSFDFVAGATFSLYGVN